MADLTPAQKLAQFAAGLRYDDLPPEVIRRAKELILNIVGVSLAARPLPSSESMLGMVRALGGAPESTVWGSDEKVPACNAALANGTMAHALDYDDTQLPAQAHLSASIVPAAIAGAEAAGADGRAVIAAAVAGWEVGLRVGSAAPGRFVDGGFHPTSICGTFGSTATFGSVMKLTPAQLTHAFGIAGSAASGTLAFMDDPSWVKQMHAGWGAHAGCIAATLAQRGFTGPATIFEGRWGLFETHIPSRQFDLGVLVGGLGSEWTVLRTVIKPYPSGAFNHAFIDAALYLRERYGVDPAEIESFHCKVSERGVGQVCEPLHLKMRPRDGYYTKFSLPYSVAVALLTGRAGLREFSDAMAHDPAVLDLAARFSYSVDEQSDFPLHYPGWLIIKMRDGTVCERHEPVERGSLERPLRDDEVIAKFRECVRGVLDDASAGAVIESVMTLERQTEIGSLVKLCACRRTV